MTIRKGEAWGETMSAPPQLPLLRNDTTVHQWIVRHRLLGEPITPFGIAGGDLARTLGGGTPDRFAGETVRVCLDVVRVEANGEVTWSTSHVVARRGWWRGQVLFAMTAQFFDGLDLAPRAHPNDGKVDVLTIDAALSVRDRVVAKRRARTGTHVPHPSIATSQVAELQVRFDRRMVLWVDGERFTTASEFRLVVEPDAYVAFV